MKSTQTSHGFQAPSNLGRVKATRPDQLLIPRPQLKTLQSVYNTTKQASTAPQAANGDSDGEGWGSDFEQDAPWTEEEQKYFDKRFEWEERLMKGVVGEPPPVPPRSWAK